MGGGMEAHKNRFIEDWGTARENLEHNFRWTRRNFALVGIFGIALPLLVYKGIVREFVISFLSLLFYDLFSCNWYVVRFIVSIFLFLDLLTPIHIVCFNPGWNCSFLGFPFLTCLRLWISFLLNCLKVKKGLILFSLTGRPSWFSKCQFLLVSLVCS